MRPQHDNDTSCTESIAPLRDQLAVAAVGKTTVDSETSSLLSNRLNLYDPAVTLQRSVGFASFICPTEIIENLESTENDNRNDDNIGCIKGNDGEGSRPHRSQSSLDCTRSRLNQNEEVMCAGSLPEEYEDDVDRRRFEPICRDLTATVDDLRRNSFSGSAEEGGSLRCCWMIDLSSPGEVAASEGVASSTSSPVNSILVLSSAISSSIPSPDISQDLSCHSDDLDFSVTSSTCDLISRSEHENETRTDFYVGRNAYKMKTGFGDIYEKGIWSASLSSRSSVSLDRMPEAVKEPAVNEPTTPSPASFSWYQTPSSGTGRVTWLCNYGCHKPVRWKYRLCETEHRRHETGRQKDEEKEEQVERNGKTDLFSRNSFRQSSNTNEVTASEVPAPLPLLARGAGVIYSKDCLVPEVFAMRFLSSADKDVNCNFDHWTGNYVESAAAAATLLPNSHATSTTYAPPVSSSSDGMSGMAEAAGQAPASVCSSSSRDSDEVAKGRRDCRRREARSIDDVSVSLQVKVSKLQEQRCYLAEVLRRYHEERRMQQRQLIRLQRMSGSARKKELMVNILQELRLMLASQVVSLQRSYDQILSRQWRSIFHCIVWS